MEKIRTVCRRGQTLCLTLVNLKDLIPIDRTTNCVYKIRCKDCARIYIGQTARELRTRTAEHRRCMSRPPKNDIEHRAVVRNSAIAMYALDTGHEVDLDNVEVVRRGLRVTSQTLTAEAVEIANADDCVNRIEGVEISNA